MGSPNVSDWGHPSRRDLADGKREPLGPRAIVVDDKVVNIVTFPLALGRTDAGGPARVTRFSRSVAVATGSPSAEQLARLHGLGRKHHVARNNPAHRPDYHLARRL